MKDEKTVCKLCGGTMPQGEEAFNYHGYSGPCPKKPISDSPSSPCAETMTTYPDGVDHPHTAVEFRCNNAFVSRCVGYIADENIPDAEWACEVLNKYGHLVKHGSETQ